MKKGAIFLFGDSITRGAFDTEMGGWAERLKTLANQLSVKNNFKPIVSIFNMGIGGDDTDGLLKRFKFETEQRISSKHENFFIFSFGTNDVAILVETKEFVVDKDKYTKNIEQIINEARSFSNNIIFLTIPPVVEEITNNISQTKRTRTNHDIEVYNDCLFSVCEKENIPLIDIHKAFIEHDNYEELFVNDGLHPNTSGHILIFNMIKNYFDKHNIL